MVVTSPPPRNAWTPRAEPCTIFGSVDDIPNAQWVYQKGWIKARTDIQPEGLSNDDLRWVRLHAGDWDAPDDPLDLPDPADYDAAAAHQPVERDGPPGHPGDGHVRGLLADPTRTTPDPAA